MKSQSSGLIGLRNEIECVNIDYMVPFVWNLIGRHHMIKRYSVASDLRKASLVSFSFESAFFHSLNPGRMVLTSKDAVC